MATKNPRTNVVVESDLYNYLSKLAKNSGISLSLLSRDLLKEALEIREDLYWDKVAIKRHGKTFYPKCAKHTSASFNGVI